MVDHDFLNDDGVPDEDKLNALRAEGCLTFVCKGCGHIRIVPPGVEADPLIECTKCDGSDWRQTYREHTRQLQDRAFAPRELQGPRGKIDCDHGQWFVTCGVCSVVRDIGRVKTRGGLQQRRSLARERLLSESPDWFFVKFVGWLCPDCTGDMNSGKLNIIDYKRRGMPILRRDASD